MKLFLASMKGICIAAVLTFSSVSSAIDDSTHIVVEVPVLHTEVAYGNVVEREPVKSCKEVVTSRKGDTSSDTAEILGALLGGAIGKEIDSNDGSGKEGAILGALLGASIASDMEKENARKKAGYKTEVQCTTEYREVKVLKEIGYKVAYEFGGYLFQSTVSTLPGETMEVRVSALPVGALAY